MTTPQTLTTLPPRPATALRVLLADDSRAQRRLLAAALGRWGYHVAEAGSGLEALELARAQPFDFVLSDWMMPGLDGPALCRAFRALQREGYGYFILMTARNEREEVARGLEAGADDFLSKPVNLGELQARMLAGGRIVEMEKALTDKNAQISAALSELRALHESLDRDLLEARKLQMTLVRERQRDFGRGRIAVTLQPSGHVGGDLVGYFPINARRLAFFAIDVAGHGVTSAIMAARLAGMLSTAGPDGSVALLMRGNEAVDAWPPEMVVARLNRMVIEAMQVEQYFTCVYAEADLETGRVALVQAGHPHPLLLRADGRVEAVGAGGLPVGLFPGATWARVDLRLKPGDRLLLMSDGMTEAAGPAGRELGEDGLSDLVQACGALRGHDFLQALVWGIENWVGAGEVADDVSAAVFEWTG